LASESSVRADKPVTNTRIVGSNPATCVATDSKRQTIVFNGDFPPLDAHGAALVITQPLNPPLMVTYDPRGLTVPSFSASSHALTLVFDGTQWCQDAGTMSLQVALGGHWSNVYSLRVIDTDDD
jgi:hypothetical protein